MRYLVTGGAGFIGSNTVDELVRRGHSVTVLDDLSSGKEENLANVREQITFIRGTITDRAVVAQACQGADYVLHLAAYFRPAFGEAAPGNEPSECGWHIECSRRRARRRCAPGGLCQFLLHLWRHANLAEINETTG